MARKRQSTSSATPGRQLRSSLPKTIDGQNKKIVDKKSKNLDDSLDVSRNDSVISRDKSLHSPSKVEGGRSNLGQRRASKQKSSSPNVSKNTDESMQSICSPAAHKETMSGSSEKRILNGNLENSSVGDPSNGGNQKITSEEPAVSKKSSNIRKSARKGNSNSTPKEKEVESKSGRRRAPKRKSRSSSESNSFEESDLIINESGVQNQDTSNLENQKIINEEPEISENLSTTSQGRAADNENSDLISSFKEQEVESESRRRRAPKRKSRSLSKSNSSEERNRVNESEIPKVVAAEANEELEQTGSVESNSKLDTSDLENQGIANKEPAVSKEPRKILKNKNAPIVDSGSNSTPKQGKIRSRLGKRKALKQNSGSPSDAKNTEGANQMSDSPKALKEAVILANEEPVHNEDPEEDCGEDIQNMQDIQPGPSQLPEESSKATQKGAKSGKRKPNSKKSPNPKRKKKLKKCKNYDFLAELLEFEDIPLSVKVILQKDDALEVLSGEEIDTIFENLSETVKAAAELIFENLKNEVALKWLKAVSQLAVCIIENLPADEPIKESISHVATLLGLLLKLDLDSDLKQSIAEVCSLLLVKNCEFSDQVFFLTMNCVIDLILKLPAKSQCRKKFVKILHSLERVIARLQITSKACEPLVGKFINITQCKDIMTIKEAKAFVSFLLTMDLTLLPRFHQAIKDVLAVPQTKRAHADGYGEAYYLAWLHSAENKEVRKAVENKCFQNYMMAIFTIQRSGLEMSNLGHNVFTILSFLHNKREHLRLSKAITTLYTPLLWRYLHFENNLIRCNAAEIFFDVYPLEYHGEAKPDRIMHLDRQHQEMADLLVDDSHLVRVLAVRGVFACMKSNWNTFSPESLQKLFQIIINDCTNDGSSSDVRCAVYRGFSSLIDNEQCHEYLTSLLKNLGNYLGDECDKVRLSFIRMLQKVKEADLEDLQYWKISDIKLISMRLGKEENESVAKALTELLFSNIFSKNHDDKVTLKRLIKLVQLNPAAGRKLIQYSSKLLHYEEAYRIMMVILSTVRAHIMDKMARMRAREAREEAAAEKDDIPDELKPKLKKRRKHYRPLSEKTDNVDDDSCQDTSKSSSGDSSDSNTSKINDSVSASKAEESVASSVEKLTPFDELPVSHALFDIVSLLWIIHAGTLNSRDHEKDLEDLYELSVSMIPIMLKYFKGTETFFGVLQLASLIPLSKILGVCHIASACVSQLRHCGHVMQYQECRCIVSTLCSWNRGLDIIELVYDWLNDSFKAENLNFSVLPTHRDRTTTRKKKIRFETKDAKPICGLKLIDMIFSNPVDKKRVLTKHYDQFFELFNYLERIKTLIEKRIENEEEFASELLSDEFLNQCLYTYLKLAIMLHKDPEGELSATSAAEAFNATEFYSGLLQWCERTLVENLETQPEPIICSFINIIIQAGRTLLALEQADRLVLAEMLKVLSRCLNCGKNGLLVLESSVNMLSQAMSMFPSYYSAKRLNNVYKTIVPHFLECILTAATFKNYDHDRILECVKDIIGMKKCLREVFLNYAEVHAKDKTNSILPRIINIVAKAVVQSFMIEVLKNNVAVQFVKLNNLPFFTNFLLTLINSRPVFCSLFLTCLNRNVTELYAHNGAQILATISLLFTLAMNKFKFKEAEFKATVKLTNDVMMKYRTSRDDSNLNDSACLIDQEHNLDELDVQNQGAQLMQKISEKIELFT